MNKSSTQSMTVVRSLASDHKSEQLERCLQQQVERGRNSCYSDTENEPVVNALAKASFVRKQVEQGLSITQAVRELGKRMRLAQGSSSCP